MRHAIDDNPVDEAFPMHIHEQCEIYYFVSGNVEYIVEGSGYLLENDSILLMRPSEAHRAKILSPSKYERYAVNFPMGYFSKIDSEDHLTKAFTDRPLGINNLYTKNDFDTVSVRELLHEICIEKDAYDRQLAFNTHLPVILNRIYKTFSKQTTSTKSTPTISEQIVTFVNAHLYEDISIPSLASSFHLSASQFRRVFKRMTGASPWEYIVKKRLIFAKEQIHNGLSAQKACELSGFSDYSAFYRAYRKLWGVAPTYVKR